MDINLLDQELQFLKMERNKSENIMMVNYTGVERLFGQMVTDIGARTSMISWKDGENMSGLMETDTWANS